MKPNITNKPEYTKSYNLGVIIIFILVTILFVISFAKSSYRYELFENKKIVKSENINSINK